jgi:hypothetical protein
MADPILWERLTGINEDELFKRIGVVTSEKGIYDLDVLNRTYQIDANRQKILQSGNEISREMDEHCSTSFIMYLLEGKDIKPTGEWVSPLDLPFGAQFFRGPHAVPVNRIIARFGNAQKDFDNVCHNLSGKPIEFADTAYAFDVFKHLPMAALLWVADDEFPARVSLLVDRTAHLHFQLDALLGALMILEDALLNSISN